MKTSNVEVLFKALEKKRRRIFLKTSSFVLLLHETRFEKYLPKTALKLLKHADSLSDLIRLKHIASKLPCNKNNFKKDLGNLIIMKERALLEASNDHDFDYRSITITCNNIIMRNELKSLKSLLPLCSFLND